MRTSERDKQKMYYALYTGMSPIYELDDDGNKIVERIDEEGNIFYRETGDYKASYGTPVEFWASISSNLNEMHCREFGVDQSSIYAELCMQKDYVPLAFGTKIWKNSDIEWIDEEAKIPNGDSADYTVKGLLDEYINFDWYLLARNNNS